MNWDSLLALASVTLSLIAGVGSYVGSRSNHRAEKSQRQSLKVVNINDVLIEPDLNKLGALFVDGLGKTSMPSYVRDPEIRSDFRRIFNDVVAYIGVSKPVVVEESIRERNPEFTNGKKLQQVVTDAGQTAMDEVTQGETWNALARMRRELEKTMAKLVPQNDKPSRPMHVGLALSVAENSGLLPAGMSQKLKFPISVANAAIHGEEIEEAVAVESIRLLDEAVAQIIELI